MRKHSYLISVLILILSGILCTTMMSAGADDILGTDATGTSLVMTDLAFRDTVSYTGDPSDWRIYFHPGVRFGTDDRVIGFYDLMVPVYLSEGIARDIRVKRGEGMEIHPVGVPSRPGYLSEGVARYASVNGIEGAEIHPVGEIPSVYRAREGVVRNDGVDRAVIGKK